MYLLDLGKRKGGSNRIKVKQKKGKELDGRVEKMEVWGQRGS